METVSKNLEKRWTDLANTWTVSNRDPVVGLFDEHNSWEDYEYLFKDVPDLDQRVVLDFGCGPGRNLVKYTPRVSRIDGVDISSKNLENAKLWISHNQYDTNNYTLYHCNGYNLENIPADSYDLVISTIAMQHIASYSIRFNYLTEFFRVLKKGGMISIQMSYGKSRDYYMDDANEYMVDSSIQSPSQVEDDLTKIGFVDFKHYIRPHGPGDNSSPNWIFFSARKE